MTELELLQQEGETVTEKSKTITISNRPKNGIEKLLMKIGLMKRERVFEISPILVGNRLRISARACFDVPENLFVDGILDLEKAWPVIKSRTDDFIYIVAVCIQNNRNEPSKRLLEYLRWTSDEEFFNILDKSLSMAGLKSFMHSIILIKGSSVLNVQEKDVTPVMDPE